jgi:hypothetical protein
MAANTAATAPASSGSAQPVASPTDAIATPPTEIQIRFPFSAFVKGRGWKANLRRSATRGKVNLIITDAETGKPPLQMPRVSVELLYPIMPGLRQKIMQDGASGTKPLKAPLGWVHPETFERIAAWIIAFCENPHDNPKPLNLSVANLKDAVNVWVTLYNIGFKSGLKDARSLLFRYMDRDILGSYSMKMIFETIEFRHPLTDHVVDNLIRLRSREGTNCTKFDKVGVFLEEWYPTLLRILLKHERQRGLFRKPATAKTGTPNNGGNQTWGPGYHSKPKSKAPITKNHAGNLHLVVHLR